MTAASDRAFRLRVAAVVAYRTQDRDSDRDEPRWLAALDDARNGFGAGRVDPEVERLWRQIESAPAADTERILQDYVGAEH